jgi:hypothetical protein
MLSTVDEQLDELLGTSIAEIDIPDHLNELAITRYEGVGSWLCDGFWGGSSAGCEVYPQGSFRLGTVVRPIHERDEYDIDLVCRRNISKESTTQADLKRDVGQGVTAYANSRPDGDPAVEDGKRCWTLVYGADHFHMDVLPSVPDLEGVPNAILLTDKELRTWQHSNPIDYADWFRRTMEQEFNQRRIALAKTLRSDVEDVPSWRVKTTLQRTVQALKRHRDLFFADSPDDRPASIIITTLAAQAYVGGGRLYEALVEVTSKMPALVNREAGVWWVANPVQPMENFADRWRSHPERAERFFEWMERAQDDFSGFGTERGIDVVLKKMAKTLGETPAKKAGAVLGSGLSESRNKGQLGMASATGLLGVSSGRSIPQHTFHGDPPGQRGS